MTTLADLGEFGLVAEIGAAVAAASGGPAGDVVLLGIGDDAAVLDLSGAPTATSMDLLVEDVHFRTTWSEPQHVGRKAVAVNVADIEAMGGRAEVVLVGLSAPPETPLTWVRGFLAGLQEEAGRAGVVLVGGDTTRGPVIQVAVTVIGRLVAGRAVTRSGARPGDVVAIAGRLGWAAAGWTALRRGFRSPRQAVQAHQVPEVPYGQGEVAAVAGASALIDVSDGLLADLGHIAAGSEVSIDLEAASFTVADPVRAVAQATGTNPLALVLTGGEDHALAGTFAAADVPAGWVVVGRVLPVADELGPQVTVDGQPWEDATGWDHFRG